MQNVDTDYDKHKLVEALTAIPPQRLCSNAHLPHSYVVSVFSKPELAATVGCSVRWMWPSTTWGVSNYTLKCCQGLDPF